MGDGATGGRDVHHAAPGGLDRFAHRLAHLIGLARRHADVALPIAHGHQRVEAEAPTALDDLGHAVDRDDVLDVAVAFAATTAIVPPLAAAATARPTPPATAPAAPTAPPAPSCAPAPSPSPPAATALLLGRLAAGFRREGGRGRERERGRGRGGRRPTRTGRC